MTSPKLNSPDNPAMPEDPTKLPNEAPKLPKTRRKRTPSPQHSAAAKAQAVLAIWTERMRPAEVCRQMGVAAMTVAQWQDRAMEGMLQALESRVSLANGEALSPRLQALLKRRQTPAMERLASRLEHLQPQPPASSKAGNPPPRETPSN